MWHRNLLQMHNYLILWSDVPCKSQDPTVWMKHIHFHRLSVSQRLSDLIFWWSQIWLRLLVSLCLWMSVYPWWPLFLKWRSRQLLLGCSLQSDKFLWTHRSLLSYLGSWRIHPFLWSDVSGKNHMEALYSLPFHHFRLWSYRPADFYCHIFQIQLRIPPFYHYHRFCGSAAFLWLVFHIQ